MGKAVAPCDCPKGQSADPSDSRQPNFILPFFEHFVNPLFVLKENFVLIYQNEPRNFYVPWWKSSKNHLEKIAKI